MQKKTILFLIAAMVMTVMALPTASMAGGTLTLLSMDEAKELNMGDEEWSAATAPKAFPFGIGPKIIFETPKVAETEKGMVIVSPSQMSLLVVFKNGISPVDMSTLNIKASKGWFSKNLTKRLAPYLEGTALKAENVKIPSGRFKLEIKISDTDGNESMQEYLCEIRD